MHKYLITCFLLLIAGYLPAQTEAYFQKSDAKVYDYSNILTADQYATMDNRLQAFSDSTSNQIAVIYTPTLYGEEIKDLGTRIGQAWGVGQKDLDNGVIIMIKTKTEEEPDGDVAILPGTGLEGVLPDVFCARIIDDTMLNELIEGNYYQAVVNALNVIEPVCRGEYNYEQYQIDNDEDDTISTIIGLLIWGCIIWYIVRRIKRGGHSGFSGGGHHYGGGSSYGGGSYHSSSHRSSSHSSFGGGSFGGGGASRKF